jgi:rhamnosyltransferase subunit B
MLVHHGGIGTTAQALRAGRPQLVIPMAHDQFDNAARVKRLGVGSRIAHARASERALTEQLRGMWDYAPYADAAREIAAKLRDEDGAPIAAAALARAFGG